MAVRDERRQHSLGTEEGGAGPEAAAAAAAWRAAERPRAGDAGKTCVRPAALAAVGAGEADAPARCQPRPAGGVVGLRGAGRAREARGKLSVQRGACGAALGRRAGAGAGREGSGTGPADHGMIAWLGEAGEPRPRCACWSGGDASCARRPGGLSGPWNL